MNVMGVNGVHILSPEMRQRFWRALFLDFDGVLHAPGAIAGAKPPLSPAQIRAGWPKTFEHVELLAEQLQGCGEVGVIVCSSWRMFLDDDALGSLLQPIAAWYAGSTGLPYQPRDVAIKTWLKANDILDFAVIDDNASFFPGNWPTLIVCDAERGLDDPAVLAKLSDWLSHPLLPHQ